MKDCPDCGESILETALKCRFCGVVLEADAYADLKDEARPPVLARKFSCLWILFLLGGLTGVVVVLSPFGNWNADRVGFLLGAVVVTALGLGLIVRDVRKRKGGVLLPVGFAWLIGLGLANLGALVVVYGLAVREEEYRRQRRAGRNERATKRHLETIGLAQSLFREADKEGDGNLDYGTLAELANSGTTGLIDQVLGSGTRSGYLFECSYSASTPEFLWFATARPQVVGVTGERYYATNHEGVVYFREDKPFALNTVDCQMPDAAREPFSDVTVGDYRLGVKEGAPLAHVRVGQVYVFTSNSLRVTAVDSAGVSYVKTDYHGQTFEGRWRKLPPNPEDDKLPHRTITAGGRTWDCVLRYDFRWCPLEDGAPTFPEDIQRVGSGGNPHFELLRIEEPE